MTNSKLDNLITSIARATEGSIKFNQIAGRENEKDIASAMKIHQEEIQEMLNGFNTKNPKEFLDGVVDSFVTSIGLMIQMQNIGFDVASALDKVQENNLTKFIAVGSTREVQPLVKQEFSVLENMGYRVLLNKNNKVLKPKDYQQVNLDSAYSNVNNLEFSK